MSEIIKSKGFLLGLIVVVMIFMYIPFFFVVPAEVQSVQNNLVFISVIITAFGLIIGVYTLTRREILRINKRGRGWPYSVWLLSLLWIVMIVGVIFGQSSPIFGFFTNSIVLPGDSTIYSILMFFMISAGARAFRWKDTSSIILFGVAFFVLFYQAPMTQSLWGGFTIIGSWLTNNLGMSVTRVFTITAALGAINLGIRVMTGREMGVIGLMKRKEEES